MQRAEFAELVGAPTAVAVGAAARVTLVHVLLAGDALEERVLDHCGTGEWVLSRQLPAWGGRDSVRSKRDITAGYGVTLCCFHPSHATAANSTKEKP